MIITEVNNRDLQQIVDFLSTSKNNIEKTVELISKLATTDARQKNDVIVFDIEKNSFNVNEYWIRDTVEKYFDLYDIKLKTRKQEFVYARYVAIHLINKYVPSLSLKVISGMFSTSDHTYAIHAKKWIAELFDSSSSKDREMRNQIEELDNFVYARITEEKWKRKQKDPLDLLNKLKEEYKNQNANMLAFPDLDPTDTELLHYILEKKIIV